MLSQKNILIVEDNCFIALDLSIAVEEQRGLVVGPVASAAEAMELIETHSIAAAILDCDLVDRDVTPVALSLIEKSVPLIIHTGTGLPAELAATHPTLPVIKKPVKTTFVVARLIEHIRECEANLDTRPLG